MKIYANIKSENGRKKSMGANDFIRIELSHKNKTLGTLGLYAIAEDKGYRLVWHDENLPYPESSKVLIENEEGYKLNDEKKTCEHGKDTEYPCSDCIHEILR